MLCEANLTVSWRARPRGFIALMSLYESNHLRFVHLVGDPRALSGTHVSSVDGDCDLLLSVVGHMPYTSTFNLTYLLPARSSPAAEPALSDRFGADALERQPDLRLRVYHDARLLEVEVLRALRGERELHQRWLRNIMLNKWLEYCAERGHRFLR